jgi:hypothetical protein
MFSALCIFSGAMLGMWLRKMLPQEHLRDDSQTTVKVGAGMIATLSALVLGMLVSSAKQNFDTLSSETTQSAAKFILLDRLLSDYGAEALPARAELHKSLSIGINIGWPREKTQLSVPLGMDKTDYLDSAYVKVIELKPVSDAQRTILSQAQQLVLDLRGTRWLIVEQLRSNVPGPLLAVLLFWFTILHISFGLFAPRNKTVTTVMLICSLSVSCAIFLIFELNHPFRGLIRVSSTPMDNALEYIGQSLKK